MDQKISEAYREKVFDELYEVIYNSLGGEEFFADDATDAAQFIKDKLETLNTGTELIAFLQELGNKWPEFQTTYLAIKEELESFLRVNQIQNEINNMSA